MKEQRGESNLLDVDAGVTAPAPARRQHATVSAESADRADALCERVQQLARQTGEQSQRAKREEARTLVEQSRARAEAESHARVSEAQQQTQMRVNRKTQAASLTARAKLADVRWSLLTAVLDEAESEIAQLRTTDPERYASSLVGLFHRAAEQLGAPQLIVRAASEDVALLRQRLQGVGCELEFVVDDIAAGLIVTTPDGKVSCDQSIARRRQRFDDELRLAAAELLFPDSEQSTGGGNGEPKEVDWCGTMDFSGSLVHVRDVRQVGFDEQVEVNVVGQTLRRGQTLAISEDEAVVQVFEGTQELSREATAIRFLGSVPEMVVSEELLGRVFDGLGRPRDRLPPLLGREKWPLRGMPINPMARQYPREFIQTGVSSIDVMNSLVRGQKLPIFSGSGLPHNSLLSQILRQARLLEEESAFAVVFVAMGINHSAARFFQDVFESAGVMQRVSMFLNLADDPAMARLAAPRAGLTAAEYLAFERDYHVLVILTDMSNYADALREIASARNEVPARKGYPGYLYTDLAEIYERAGRIRGRAGSITLMPLVTLHNDDITHPVPDLTGYITEGQLMLSRAMHGGGVDPPMDVLPSLSRLMKDGIGAGHTRDDHAALASQLYACYAEGRHVRDLATVVGEADLSRRDRRYLKFSNTFEAEFITQRPEDNRSIFESLDRGWQLLKLVPQDELTRVTEQQLERFLGRDGSETPCPSD